MHAFHDNIISTRKFTDLYSHYHTHIAESFRSTEEEKAAARKDERADLYKIHKRRNKEYMARAPYDKPTTNLTKYKYYICNIFVQKNHDSHTTNK